MEFTFGIALIPRATARSWRLVESLLHLTLTSIRAQTDPHFRIIVAGHDRPLLPSDPRISFLEVDWPVEEPGPHNEDGGRKKHAINDLVLGCGGGLLMFVDADDWVDRRLVEMARALIGPDQAGGLIESGLAVDLRTLRTAPLPHPGVFPGEFYRLCGSSTVAHLRPDLSDPVRRDPFTILRSHHQWKEVARDHGLALARLPVSGAYVINTTENHSEIHGPLASWRQSLAERVSRRGRPLDAAAAASFGLDLELIGAASDQVREPSPALGQGRRAASALPGLRRSPLSRPTSARRQ